MRWLILDEHAELRELLEEIRDLSAHVRTDAEHESLTLAVRALVLLFGEHLRSEEAMLLPLVECMTPWGPQRARDLEAEHAEQRLLLREVFERATRAKAHETLAELASSFSERLLRDMTNEEQSLLTPEILHDPVAAAIGDV